MQVFLLANEKGGWGKTTTAVNLAAAFAEAGFRTLLCDLDGQANASRSLGLPITQEALGTNLSDVLGRGLRLQDALFETGYERLSLAPTSGQMKQVGASLRVGRDDDRFARALHTPATAASFDVVVVDAPPGIGPLLLSALRAAHWVLIPIELSVLSQDGLLSVATSIADVTAASGWPVAPLGVLLSRVRGDAFASRQVRGAVRAYTGADERRLVFDTELRELATIQTATYRGLPVIHHAPRTPAAEQYRRLVREVQARLADRGSALEMAAHRAA